LLPNGLVLVAGGEVVSGQGVTTDTAELYDPAAGTWKYTGKLNTGRDLHTATLLQNGKVLVAGGQFDVGSGSNLSQLVYSAELYDPVGGVWSPTGDLNALHSSHTATLMQGGKVLVASGDDPYDDFSSSNGTAEIYDPGKATWSYTGNLSVIRNGHTATLLPNGKVLVNGGVYFSAANGAELYDPLSGTWAPTSDVITPRFFGHTATLLSDGKVLVAGGASEHNNLTALASAEVYDDGASSGTIDSTFTGAWYDPAQSGHGLFVEILPGNRVYVGWMTFNPAGTEQAWFVGVGTYTGNTATITPVILPTGGRWIPNFDPHQIVNNVWGTLMFTFTDNDHGKVEFSSALGYGSGSMSLTRLTRPIGPLTATTIGDAAAPGAIGPGFTGAWYDPAQIGHGLFMEILPRNRVFVGWFTFNPAGTEQAWFAGVGTYSSNVVTITAVEQPTGGRWIPNFDPSQVVDKPWGTLTFTFGDCNHGEVVFDSLAGYGMGSMNVTRLTQPAGLSCP
jgi:hypothetical protein